MTTATIAEILIAVAVLVIGGLGLWIAMRFSRSRTLREKFGPEYDYTLEKAGNRRSAEETLAEREKRVSHLEIRPLDEAERERYHADWVEVQADFVDDPSKSVEEGNRLVTEVMVARGYPVADFEQRAADLSVMFPDFVSTYRTANAIALKNRQNKATTEELRQAMVYYHALFEELLGSTNGKEVEVMEKELVNQ
jgi:hypothetical protein